MGPGALVLVGVLPDGSTPPGGSFTGPYDWLIGTTDGGASAFMYMQGAVSSDASRVYFTAGGTGQLYLRENPTSASASTMPVSASQKTNGSGPGGTDPHGPQPADFMAATPDGSHALLMSSEETDANNANTGTADQGSDLYQYNAGTGTLTDLTPDSTDANGAGVQGVLGMSDDGLVRVLRRQRRARTRRHPRHLPPQRLPEVGGHRQLQLISVARRHHQLHRPA